MTDFVPLPFLKRVRLFLKSYRAGGRFYSNLCWHHIKSDWKSTLRGDVRIAARGTRGRTHGPATGLTQPKEPDPKKKVFPKFKATLKSIEVIRKDGTVEKIR